MPRRSPAAKSPLYTPAEWTAAVASLRLSERQADIVELLLQGKRDKQIAQELGLKLPTVRTYLSRLFIRFGVADRVDLMLHVLAVIRRQFVMTPEVTAFGRSGMM